ncbi:MAG: hypothetical protein DHS20C11_00600 [Lysobacteraceae bacterium]|nr:MAG: hypothetical protein DHS20C11_00600 [Xanthomonadaceae bacterium]
MTDRRRRSLLTTLGLTIAGAGAYFWLRPPPVAQSEMLPFHPAQMDGLLPEDSAYLVQQLTNKGIIDAQGEVHPERISQLKASEPLLAYRNQYYLEAELQYYALMSMRTTGESR